MAISLTTVQQALTAMHTEDPGRVPSPGRVDGTWGPITEASFEAWVDAYASHIPGQVDVDVSGERGSQALSISPESLEAALRLAANRYVGGGAATPRPSTSTRRPRPEEAGPVPEAGHELAVRGMTMPRWGWWALGAAALVGVVGFVWWWQQRKRRS